MRNFKSLSDLSFSNYSINDEGVVINNKFNRIVKGSTSHNGYKVVSLKNDENVFCTLKVHRLVLKTFMPNKEQDYLTVNHIDGNKLNNSLSNLEWVTMTENNQHALENNLRCVKHLNSSKKEFPKSDIKYDRFSENLKSPQELTEEDVHIICKHLQDGYRLMDILGKFGYSRWVLSQIKDNKYERFKHIIENYDFSSQNKRKNLSNDVILKLCDLFQKGYSATKAAKELGIHERYAMKVKSRQTYRNITKDIVW